jgi:hypothetical protein
MIAYCPITPTLTNYLAENGNAYSEGFANASTSQRTLPNAAAGYTYLRYTMPSTYASSGSSGSGGCKANCTMPTY